MEVDFKKQTLGYSYADANCAAWKLVNTIDLTNRNEFSPAALNARQKKWQSNEKYRKEFYRLRNDFHKAEVIKTRFIDLYVERIRTAIDYHVKRPGTLTKANYRQIRENMQARINILQAANYDEKTIAVLERLYYIFIDLNPADARTNKIGKTNSK
jgi:hypothetical protein